MDLDEEFAAIIAESLACNEDDVNQIMLEGIDQMICDSEEKEKKEAVESIPEENLKYRNRVISRDNEWDVSKFHRRILSPETLALAAFLEDITDGKLIIPGAVAAPTRFCQERWKELADPRIKVWYRGRQCDIFVPPFDAVVAGEREKKFRTKVTVKTVPVQPTLLVRIGFSRVAVVRRNGKWVWREFSPNEHVEQHEGVIYHAMIPNDEFPQYVEEVAGITQRVHPDCVQRVTVVDMNYYKGVISGKIKKAKTPKVVSLPHFMGLLSSQSSDTYLHSKRFYNRLSRFGDGDQDCVRRMVAMTGFIADGGGWKYKGWVRPLSTVCGRIIDKRLKCTCEKVFQTALPDRCVKLKDVKFVLHGVAQGVGGTLCADFDIVKSARK